MTDFRALCAELIEELNAATNHDDLAIRAGDVIARAHRALAEPFRPAPMAKGGRALQLVLAVGADCAGGAHLSTEQCHLAFDLLAKAYPGTVAPIPLIKPLPADYFDPEHSGTDREMLEVFYAACLAEGGTADEITLRGLRAVIRRWETTRSSLLENTNA